jgi:hypothetical protein
MVEPEAVSSSIFRATEPLKNFMCTPVLEFYGRARLPPQPPVFDMVVPPFQDFWPSMRASDRSIGRQTAYFMSFGCFSNALRTESSICRHWPLSDEDRKNFACHPCSSPFGDVQKASTAASGVPFLVNFASALFS